MKKLPTTRDLQGNVILAHNLPPPDTSRWTANKKAIVVRAVASNLVSLEEVLARYSMSEREFVLWADGLHKHGKTGLQTTYFQKRQCPN